MTKIFVNIVCKNYVYSIFMLFTFLFFGSVQFFVEGHVRKISVDIE